MEDLQSLVAESLARNGFQTPEMQSPLQGPLSTVRTRSAASLEGGHGQEMELAPLPSGF